MSSSEQNQPKPSIFDDPRYKENPIYPFFEDFVLDVIGKLPAEKSDANQALNLQRVFSTKSDEWHQVIREVLQLSETIDIAILDLWIRNQSCYDDTKQGFFAFAQDFTDHYMADDSKIDVWPEGALEAAKQRIKQYHSQ